MTASFHAFGTSAISRDFRNIRYNGSAILVASSFNNLGWMPSGPCDFEMSSFCSFFIISVLVKMKSDIWLMFFGMFILGGISSGSFVNTLTKKLIQCFCLFIIKCKFFAIVFQVCNSCVDLCFAFHIFSRFFNYIQNCCSG